MAFQPAATCLDKDGQVCDLAHPCDKLPGQACIYFLLEDPDNMGGAVAFGFAPLEAS